MHITILIFGIFQSIALSSYLFTSMGLSMSLHKWQYYNRSKNINTRHFYPKNEVFFSNILRIPLSTFCMKYQYKILATVKEDAFYFKNIGYLIINALPETVLTWVTFI